MYLENGDEAIILDKIKRLKQAINWGIIGCGDVTEVKSGPAFNKVEQSNLVAVMRRDPIKVKDYAKRHNVSRFYTDANELINDPEVNAIYIATPPLYHEQYALDALRAGKPVYVEKPMAISYAAAKRLNNAANQSGGKLSVAHYRRELPLFKKVKQLLNDGVIGDVRFVNMQMLQPHNAPLITKTDDNWRVDPTVSGGGLFHDLAPHQIDLMLAFFGDVNSATGISGNQGNYYAADDIVQGAIKFKNNVLFNGLWCFTVRKNETKDLCEITGSKGKLSFSIFKHDWLRLNIDDEVEDFTFENPAHVQQPMIEKVVQYFLDEGPNPCPGDDGVEVMRVMERFTLST